MANPAPVASPAVPIVPVVPTHHHHRKNIQSLNERFTALLKEDALKDPPAPTNADEGLARLLEGNRRFLTGDLVTFMKHLAAEVNPEFRASLAGGQHPYVTIVTCADSRVSPELLFDEGLGQLFVVRVAGNRMGEMELGSVEYGALHLKTPLLIVMGHEKCGAVTAAFDDAKAEGHVQSIIRKIHPISVHVKKGHNYANEKDICIAEGVNKNVLAARDEVLKSTVIKGLVNEGKLKVVPAVYFFNGEVKIIS